MLRGTFLLTWLLLGSLIPAVTFADSDPPKYVWRLDSRAPEVIFASGFASWGTNTDVFAHVTGNSCVNVTPTERDSGFISTTANQGWALQTAAAWAIQNPGRVMYLYRIRANANFYNAERSLENYASRYPQANVGPINYIPSRQASEYMALIQIETANIQEAVGYAVVNGELAPGPVARNPGYHDRNTHAAADGYTGNEGADNRHNTWAMRMHSMIVGSCAGMRSELRTSGGSGDMFKLEAIALNLYL